MTLCYVVFYLVFILEAWGHRGDVKPLWFKIGSILLYPTYFIPMPIPFVSAIIVGVGYGFLVVFLGRALMEIITAGHRKS